MRIHYEKGKCVTGNEPYTMNQGGSQDCGIGHCPSTCWLILAEYPGSDEVINQRLEEALGLVDIWVLDHVTPRSPNEVL